MSTKILLFIGVFWGLVGGAVLAAGPEPERLGAIQNPQSNEISGIAPSLREDDLLWGINDSGHPPLIMGFGYDGSDKALLHVTVITPRDWEDMASFMWRGEPYLAIAEIGDNRAKHPDCFIYVVKEPVLPKDQAPDKQIFVDVAWTIHFSYPDGPRDAESLAVDTEAGLFYVLSKRATPPTLYSLPIEAPPGGEILTAEAVGIMSAIKEPLRRELTFFPNQPTAMDFSRAGTMAAVLTYQGLYLFRRAKGETWASTFEQDVKPWPLPPLFQAESVCFSPDGGSILVTTETLPAPIYRWRIPDPKN